MNMSNMNSRERVTATLLFQNPDRIPVDIWQLQAASFKYGNALAELLDKYELDIARLNGPMDRGYYGDYAKPGLYKDHWGSTWKMLIGGMVGEVCDPAIKDISGAQDFRLPYDSLEKGWRADRQSVVDRIAEQRRKNKFVLGGTIEPFQRMQWLRGSENLFCDIGMSEPGVYALLDKLTEYYLRYLDFWLDLDIDGVTFTEDWGTQINLLISPAVWRAKFKPVYKILFDKIKSAGKYVFFHSDGYIFDIYGDLAELGVNAVNSQLWCMGVEKAAAACAGKFTFWGELDRQDILPHGTPEDIYRAAALMKKLLFVNGGGLIGQGEIGLDVSLENARAMLECWNS
jgi:uroporphyrinogen decarboxylase